MLDGKTQGFAFLEFGRPVRHAPPTACSPALKPPGLTRM
eukprot:COSAG06_NODE_47475_length_339_cov_0.550000_1_plen_39_part_10